MEFKVYHEDDNITFHNQTIVHFSQCSANKQLSFHELLRLTSDVAVEEYRQRGLSRDILSQAGYAILVSRVSFHINRLPKENELITVSTWEEKAEALQLIRAYSITAEDGSSLVEGLSSWLLVDPAARRIIPTKKFTMREPSSYQRQNACSRPTKIIIPQELTEIASRRVLPSDIDGNGHTNNARYGAFVMDSLPEAYRNKDFSEMRLNYSKEAMLDQTLKIYAAFDDENKKITLVGKTEEDVSFESELVYR